MNRHLRKHPKHIQVAIKASLTVRLLAYPPLLLGIFCLAEQNIIAIVLTAIMIFIWTPLAFFVASGNKNPIKIEFIQLCIEAGVVGFIVPLLKFNPVFMLVVVVVTGMGGIAYGGWRLCIKRYLFLCVGMGVSILLFGYDYQYDALLSTVIIMGLSVLLSAFAISYGTLQGAKQAVKTGNILKEKKLQLEEKTAELEKKTTELERLTDKLSKYLAPQVFASIFSGKQEVKIETSRKKLTIFFSDIKDFTEITENLESEALTSLLNNYLNEMAAIALRHGGTIDKFIGDAMLIFFGDPDSKGEAKDAEACVRMAIEMRERMKYLRKKWEGEGVARPLNIRCGITTGFCTVGNFGSENRLDYTIIGGQVNLASRLELSAEPDQILISQETHALVKEKILCEQRENLVVKGMACPIQTFQVVNLIESLQKNRDNIDRRINKFVSLLQNEDLSSSDKDYIFGKILRRL